MKRARSPYNTNLAAEFWVLSALSRLGAEAHLTLGNKKSVDILVHPDPQTTFTIDVKGLADAYDWPADNIKILDRPNHFYVFLSFEGRISEPLASPSVWIIPSNQLDPFVRHVGARTIVSRALMKRDGNKYRDAWKYLLRSGSATP